MYTVTAPAQGIPPDEWSEDDIEVTVCLRIKGFPMIEDDTALKEVLEETIKALATQLKKMGVKPTEQLVHKDASLLVCGVPKAAIENPFQGEEPSVPTIE
jgi:hypothetical protein